MAEKKFVFTTKNVEEIKEKQNIGIQPPRHMNPWYDNQVGVRKKNLVFGWTKHELDEFTKCSTDIHYFVNNYAQIKLGSGKYGQMKERDYQYRMFESYTRNRFTINMSSRQVGKCVTLFSEVKSKVKNETMTLPLFKLLYKYRKKNIYDYLKHPLYWLLYKIN